MIHELKTDPISFELVDIGMKTFEIRKNDRGFNVGDHILLRETRYSGSEMRDGAPLVYTGRSREVWVRHIMFGPIYGLMPAWIIMSINLIEKP